MNLYILRHGLAADRDSAKYPDDRLRPLTRKGIAKMRREAAGMNALNIRPDLIITSPLLRAVQTADIVRSELAAPPKLKQSHALTPSADPRAAAPRNRGKPLSPCRRDGSWTRTSPKQPSIRRANRTPSRANPSEKGRPLQPKTIPVRPRTPAMGTNARATNRARIAADATFCALAPLRQTCLLPTRISEKCTEN